MFSWLQGDRDVFALITRGNYPRAVRVLEKQLKKEPDSVHLRKLLADVLERMGEKQRAVEILKAMVDEFAAAGFATKAIAVLKKIQRMDPNESKIDLRVAELIAKRDDPDSPRSPWLVSAHEAEPEDSRLVGGSSSLRRTFQTSEIVKDWLDDVLDTRPDFHWSPLLVGLTRDELTAVVGGLRLLVKNPGAIVYGQDEPGASLFILATGYARIYRRDVTGHYEQKGILREGEFFGESSVLTGSRRLSTVVAASQCELLELSRATFDNICDKHPRVREIVRRLFDSQASFETAVCR